VAGYLPSAGILAPHSTDPHLPFLLPREARRLTRATTTTTTTPVYARAAPSTFFTFSVRDTASPPVTLPVLKSNKSDRCATFVELVARHLFLCDLFRLFEGFFVLLICAGATYNLFIRVCSCVEMLVKKIKTFIFKELWSLVIEVNQPIVININSGLRYGPRTRVGVRVRATGGRQLGLASKYETSNTIRSRVGV
jgi:hypothetical protein